MLFCGSYSFLKENLKKVLESINAPFEKVTFIVHSNAMKRYLKEFLVKRLGIIANVEFYTLIDISKKIAEVEPLQDFDKEMILRKALFEKKIYLEGLPSEFNTLLQQIKEYQIDISNIKSSFVKDVIGRYESIKEKSFFDREDVHLLAIDKLKSKSTDYKTDNLIIFGIKSVPELHQKLFYNLKNYSKRVYAFVPFIIDSGFYENYPHFHEVKEFYRWLVGGEDICEKTEDTNINVGKNIFRFFYEKKEIKNENVKIFSYRSESEEIEGTAQIILDICQKSDFKDIAVVIPDIGRYLPFIKDIFGKYHIPFQLEENETYLDNVKFKKLFNIFMLKLENFSKEAVLKILYEGLYTFDIPQIEKEIISSPVYAGFDDWKIFIEEEKYPDFFHLLSVLNDLPDIADIKEYINRFRYIEDRFLADEEVKRFLEDILNRLDENKLYGSLFGSVEYSMFVEIIKSFFETEIEESKKSINGVQILSPITSEANNFRYIFFLNLNEGDFPATSEGEILVTEEELNGFDYPYHLLMHQLLSFSTLFDRGKKLFLSYLKGNFSSKEKLPSVFLQELVRTLYPEIYFNGELDFKPAEKRFYTEKDFRIENSKLIFEYDKDLLSVYRKIKENENADIEKYRMNIKITFPVKATSFQKYAQCPYRFFLEEVLKISQSEEKSRKYISPIEKGILVHKILENFYRNESRLDREKIRRWFYEGIGDIKGIKYHLFFLLPSYRIFEEKEAEKFLKKVLEFIETDIKRLKNKKMKVDKYLLEKKFEDGIFAGRIDRVDVDEKGFYYIYDYKTGKNVSDNIKEDIKSKFIQLLIYKGFLDKEGLKVKALGILAVNDDKNDFFKEIYLQEIKEIEEYLKKLLFTFKKGFFPPVKTDLCSYCQFNNFCKNDILDRKGFENFVEEIS